MLKQENAGQYVDWVQAQSAVWAHRAIAVLPEMTFGEKFDREVVFWWKRAEALGFKPHAVTHDAWERICKRVPWETREQRHETRPDIPTQPAESERPKDIRTFAGLVNSTLGVAYM